MSTDEDYVDAVDAVATDIVVTATEITTNAGSDSSDEVEAFTKRRVSWPKMNWTVYKDCESVETHPFLDDNINERDRAFVRILLDERPYYAGHGEVGATWNVVMQKCNALRDKNGQQLFIPALQDIGTLQGRMKNYIIFTNEHQQMVPMRSGCDDEKPSNLLELLHQLKEEYETGVQETQQRRTKKEAFRAAAIKLKDISVKKLELKAIQGDGGDGYDGSSSDFENQKPKKTKTGNSNVHNNLLMLIDMGKKKAEAKIISVQRKESDKAIYFQWKKDEAALNRALHAKETAVQKLEAENRKLELRLKLAILQQNINQKESDNE
jgi:hypothetical protein